MAVSKAAIAACLFTLISAVVATAADAPNPVGYPKIPDPGGGVGVFRLWYADGSWHLRTSTENSAGKKEKLLVFSGSVRSEDKVTAEGIRLEKGNGKTADSVTPHKDGKGFDFRFATHGAVDQADFTVADKGKTLKFKFVKDGQPADPTRILIGEKGDRPDKAEFTLPARPKK